MDHKYLGLVTWFFIAVVLEWIYDEYCKYEAAHTILQISTCDIPWRLNSWDFLMLLSINTWVWFGNPSAVQDHPVDSSIDHPVDSSIDHPVDNSIDHPVDSSIELWQLAVILWKWYFP